MPHVLETAVGLLATAVWFAPVVGMTAALLRSTWRHATLVLDAPARLPQGPLPTAWGADRSGRPAGALSRPATPARTG